MLRVDDAAQEWALIVTEPESSGPGSYPVDVYGLASGPDGFAELQAGGHLLCDGSSGWQFVVVPWPLPPMQPVSNISVA